MLELIKYKKIIKKYNIIFNDIFGNAKLLEIKKDKVIFTNDEGDKIIATIIDNTVKIYAENKYLFKTISFDIPKKEDISKSIIVEEIVEEKRSKGYIIEKIKRIYNCNPLNEEYSLTDIISMRYVIITNKIILTDLYDDRFLANNYSLKTTFECHCNEDDEVKTLLNNEDISNIYKDVKGDKKISRIFDLYNGIVNDNNKTDIYNINSLLLNSEAFDYKKNTQINSKENYLCGNSEKDFEEIYVDDKKKLKK